MPKDNHRRNKLDSIHQFGVFADIVPRTGEFVVLTREGAVAARTIRSGAPCDFKANPRDDVNDGGIPERADARSPDPPIEIPSRINVRDVYSRRVDVQKDGPTKGCPSCQEVMRELCHHAFRPHSDEYRVVRPKTRHDEVFEKHVGHMIKER